MRRGRARESGPLAGEEATMGEHRFGVGVGQVKARVCNQISSIVRKHGASFGWSPKGYWFSCGDGRPSDAQVEASIWADLRAAGLASEQGLLASCFTKRR